MQVRDDDARTSHEIDEVLAGFHGLERREPNAAGGRIVLELREKVHEARSTVVPECREAHTREDDLGHAGVPETADGVDDVLEAGALFGTAQRGNDTERAPARAAILDLQARARPVRVDERL